MSGVLRWRSDPRKWGWAPPNLGHTSDLPADQLSSLHPSPNHLTTSQVSFPASHMHIKCSNAPVELSGQALVSSAGDLLSPLPVPSPRLHFSPATPERKSTGKINFEIHPS